MYNRNLLAWITGIVVVSAAIWVIWPFWRSVAWAMIIAVAVWPLYKRWYYYLGRRAVLASVTFTIATSIIILLPLIWVTSLASQEIGILIVYFTKVHANQSLPPEWISTMPFAGKYLSTLWNQYILAPNSIVDIMKKFNLHLSYATVAITTLTKYSITFFFTFLCLFFILKDAKKMIEKLKIVGENRVPRWQGYLDRAPKVIRGVIDSFAIIAILTGIIMGALYYILNVPIPAILAVLTALVTVIPFAMSILLIGIAAVIAAKGMIWASIIILIVGIVLNLITDHLVRPVIIGHAVHMHFLATLFGTLGGLIAFGFIGIFLGPMIISLSLLICDQALVTKQSKT